VRVVIAGGHGKITLLLERLLAERGDQAVALIRNPGHVADVNQAGAEAVLCALDWTILRPGGLTDAPAAGRIRLAAPPVPAGTVPRADVAAVIATLLDNPGTRHQTLELTSGDTPVAAAVHRLS
jgi:NAD(P)-dependent dehydrogenase (short-subunit alcohol dehydrogenase family)